MSENPQPPKRGGLAWQKARRVWGIGERVKELADWPDSFASKELAALQYPREGTDPEKRKALNNMRAMTAALDAAIQAGKLAAIEKGCTVKQAPHASSPDGWTFARRGDESRPVYLPTPKFKTVHWHEVGRPAFAAWLRASGEEPSEHIRAWLGWKEAPEVAKIPGKVESKKAKIRAILAAIAALDPKFSTNSMPGTKADFFKLCQELDLDKEFKTITQTTFNDYLPDLCKFCRGARPTDYYSSNAAQIGVKYNKAT
jgi:hypothetical protein